MPVQCNGGGYAATRTNVYKYAPMQVAFGTTEKKVACRARPLVLGTPVRDQKYKVQQTPRGQFYPWGLLIPFWDLWVIGPRSLVVGDLHVVGNRRL